MNGKKKMLSPLKEVLVIIGVTSAFCSILGANARNARYGNNSPSPSPFPSLITSPPVACYSDFDCAVRRVCKDAGTSRAMCVADPCNANKGGCAQICLNDNGVADCFCRWNYQLNTDGKACDMVPWLEDTLDMYCGNGTLHRNVRNQVDCQKRCKEACVGISWNHGQKLCYDCLDDNLTSKNNTVFYRRPVGPGDLGVGGIIGLVIALIFIVAVVAIVVAIRRKNASA